MANEVPLQQARPQALDWAGHVFGYNAIGDKQLK